MAISGGSARVAVLSLALASLTTWPQKGIAGATYDAPTKAAIQDVVTKQLDAFARNDAKGAEAFAAPAIRDKFPEPDKFLDMVKKNYAPLVHPKSTQFGDLADSPNGPVQKMTIVADDGTVWTAIYAFQRVDGMWKIIGCGLQKDEGQQSI